MLDPWLPPPRARLFHGLNQRLPEKGKFQARVVTIHDLFPLASTAYSTRQFQQHFSKIIQQAISRADWIIAVSDATRQQMLRHTEAASGRIRVIHHGVDPPQPAAQAEQDAFREGVLGFSKEEKFFLNVGTIQTRKNVASIALAMKRLPEYRLVLTGGDGFGAEQVHSLIAKEGLAGRILRLGRTPPQTLQLLYTAATALVFPSLEEGFGMPILEAMSYGLPVITSNVSAMPEVAGDAALLVDPRNVTEIGEAMRRVAEDTTLAAELSERGKQRAGQFQLGKMRAGNLGGISGSLERRVTLRGPSGHDLPAAKRERHFCLPLAYRPTALHAQEDRPGGLSLAGSDTDASVPSVDSECSEELCCSRNFHTGESSRRAFVKLTLFSLQGEGGTGEKSFFCKTNPFQNF